MLKGLSSFSSGIMGAAKGAASSAAQAVDTMTLAADTALEAASDAVPDVSADVTSLVKANNLLPSSIHNATNGTSVANNVQTQPSDKPGQEGAPATLPPRPIDYEDYWYQADDGFWYNEYDDLGYEFADEEVLLVEQHDQQFHAKLETSVMPQPQPQPQTLPKVVKQKSTDGFSAVFSSCPPKQTKVAEVIKPTSTVEVVKPASAFDVVKPPSTVQLPSAVEAFKPASAVVAVKPVKQPRPDDFDDMWYQDDDGSWRNDYTDMGYEFAEDEDFYSEDELKQEEEKLFEEVKVKTDELPKEDTLKKDPLLSSIEPFQPIQQVEPTVINDLKVTSVGGDHRSIETTPQVPRKKRQQPADYEDRWLQDYLGNWYNEYDQEEMSSPSKAINFDKEEGVPMMPRKRVYQNPRDRWQWAFTKILQVGDIYLCLRCLLWYYTRIWALMTV